MAQKHIGVSTWLEALGMMEYLSMFNSYGGVEDLLHITESDLRDLGVKISGHRAKLISSLHILRDKYQRGRQSAASHKVTRTHLLTQHVPESPPSPLSHPDYQQLKGSPEELRADLEKELRADPSELKSRSWYHGSISRQRAESLVVTDGDFLVRDCISRPGDFVLTCSWKSVPLHFMINALVGDSILGALPKIYYLFEEGSFNSIQDLIQSYQSQLKPVTNASSVVLKKPIARSMPLSYYDSKYGALTSLATVNVYTQHHQESPARTSTGSPNSSPGMNRRFPRRSGSQPLLSIDDGNNDGNQSPTMDRCDSLPVINTPQSSPHLTRKPMVKSHLSTMYHQRSDSAPVLTLNGDLLQISKQSSITGSESNLSKPPPPKPSRIPSIKYKLKPVVHVRNRALYEDDDRDYSDYDQVKETPSWLHSETIKNSTPLRDSDIYDNNFNNIKDSLTSNIKNVKSRLFPVPKLSVIEAFESDYLRDSSSSSHTKNRIITIPKVRSHSSYNPHEFKSSVLLPENKPLEATCMMSVKSLILQGQPRVIAQHLTKADLQSLNMLKEQDLGVGVQSGLEILTLPQGKQLRLNVIERCHCMKLVVMVTILTSSTTLEKARMIGQWIQVAHQLRTTLGNLFGFVNVMDALLSPQVKRLRNMWLVLRQNHTSSAYIFDTKLKTAYNSLNDGSSLPLENVCLPHISQVVNLLERDLNSVLDSLSWEDSDPNLYGVEVLLAHLDTARIIASQFDMYRSEGSSVLRDFVEDDVLMDVFHTELHLRLLWGNKGCGVNKKDRHGKFEKLLTILSNRAEPPDEDGTAV